VTLLSGVSFFLITLVMFALMALGIPIFVSIGLAAFTGLALIFGPMHAMVDFTSFLWQSLSNFELVTIPLFVLTAMLVEESKIGDELFHCAKAWIGAVPNGLGVAVVLTCAVFASITGSSPVTAVTVGLIALPALAKEGYPDSLRGADRSFVLVTHYQRLLEHIVPDKVHVLAGGRILRSGDHTLAHELERRGYDWVISEAA